MWNLDGLFTLEELAEAYSQINTLQFLNVIPHLRANYVLKRNETLVLTEHFMSSLSAPDKKCLMDAMVNYDQWAEFNYIIYRFLIKLSKNNEHRSEAFQRFFMDRVMIGLNSKEFIKVTLELFVTYVETHPIKPSDMVKTIKDAVERTTPESILVNSLTTRFIPCAKKIWGKVFLDELSNAIGEDNQAIHLAVLKNLMDMKESNVTHETFVPHMETNDPNCQQLIFQTICRIKKTTYFYNIYDFEFVFYYIENGDPSVIIENLPYFCSHIFYCGNTKHTRLGQVCERVIHILRKIAMLLLSGKHGIEQIEVGGFLYHILTEMLIKNRTKTTYNYNADYPEKGSPLCNSLFLQKQLYLGSSRDIHTLAKSLLNMDSLVPIIRILRDLPETKDLIREEYFLIFLMKNFTDPNHLFIEEKINIFIEFLIDVYHTTHEKKLKFFTNWLQLWKDYCEHKEDFHLNIYFSLKAILAAIKRYNLPFQEEYIKLEDVDVQIDVLIKKHNEQALQEEIRLAEVMLTGSAELLIDIGQRRINEGTNTIRKILTKLESIINCNKRYVAATVTLLYKKFVANVSPVYVEFFREYLYEKISLINPEITKQSKLRRGAEHRAIIHSICAGVPNNYKESVITGTITRLLLILRTENMPAETIATAIHCINQIMEDRALKKYSNNQIFGLLDFCLTFHNNINFSLSNARYLLFRTLTTRILPSVDRRKNLQLNDIFRMYPKLYEITVEMGDSNDFNQDTKILLISFLKSASEMNLIPSSLDHHFNILPICGRMLNRTFDRTVYLVLDLFVSVIPVHDVPVCFHVIVAFLLDTNNVISVQVFYNHLYILNVLSDKLLLHIETDFCQRSIRKWQEMQKSMLELKTHEKFKSVLRTGLIYNLDYQVSILQNVAIIMSHDNIPKCLAVLNIFMEKTEISDSAKVTAADILLKRVNKNHPCYKNVILAAVIIALSVESVNHAKSLIIQLIYVLSSSEIVFSKGIINKLMLMPYEELLDKTNKCTKYIFLYTYILSYIPEIRVSENIKRLILTSFYIVEDDEAATVFHRLNTIVKNRTEVLLLGLFIVTLSDFEDRYICQSVFSHLNINAVSFEAGIETIFSMPFLKDYLKCPKAVHTFILRTMLMIVDIDRDDILLKRQFECVYKCNRNLLFSFVS